MQNSTDRLFYLIIVVITQYYCNKLSSLQRLLRTTSAKLADLKQQISQKTILLVQHIASMSLCFEVISSFVMFAVLDLRDVALKGVVNCQVFYNNICCFSM